MAEEWTRQLLEIPNGKHDYKVVLLEQNLRVSHFWSFLEEVEQGILVPPLELIFPILRLQHAIHVVYGSNELQSLTTEELSLVEDIMSRKSNFPSDKELS